MLLSLPSSLDHVVPCQSGRKCFSSPKQKKSLSNGAFPFHPKQKGKDKGGRQEVAPSLLPPLFREGKEARRGDAGPQKYAKADSFPLRPSVRRLGKNFFCPTPSSFFPPCFQERYGKFLPGQKVEGRGGGGGRRRRRTWSSASLFFFFFFEREEEEEEEEEAESLVCANPSFTSAEEAQGEISPWGVNKERKNTLALFSVQIKKSNM